VLITHLELGPEGFGEIANQRTVTKKVKGQEKQIEIAGIAATPADVKALRKDWEQHVNRAYERAGHDIEVDARSHKERGIEQEPTRHLGPTATAIERRGEPSDRGNRNRDIEQRNQERQKAPALEAEIAVLKAEMENARAVEPSRDFADPPAQHFDRDAYEADWMERVTAAAIAKEEARGAARERTEDAVPPPDFFHSNERMAARNQPPSHELHAAQPAPSFEEFFHSNERPAGHYEPLLATHEATARTSEQVTAEAQNVGLGGVTPNFDRDAYEAEWNEKVAAAGIAKEEEARRAAWQEQQRIERERTRPPNMMEARIADCAEQARRYGAVIERDEEGRRLFGAEALAARHERTGDHGIKSGTVFGPEAFAVRLDEDGITIARVTAEDVKALDAWRKEAEIAATVARTEAVTNLDRNARHFAELETGQLAAVTRAGDVYRINPDKLGDAAGMLPEKLPSVTEARAAFEADREKTETLYADHSKETAAEREAYAEEREQRIEAAHSSRDVRETLHEVGEAIDAGFRTARKAAEVIGKAFETGFNILFGAFMAAAKPTKQQRHEKAQAAGNIETIHAHNVAAEKEATEERRDWHQHAEKTDRQERELAEQFDLISDVNEPKEVVLTRGGRERERTRERDEDERER
jgi:MobA/MobL family